MSSAKRFSAVEAKRVGEQVGIDWETTPSAALQLLQGTAGQIWTFRGGRVEPSQTLEPGLRE